MRIRTDSNGFITAIGNGVTPYDHEYNGSADIEPSSDPSKVFEAWHWNSGDPELRETGASPSGDEAYAEMEAYLRDKYTLNEWAGMMDANPILIELIKNEEYQNAVNRADYLANDSDSLVDSEDADKLREVTNV